MINLVQPREHHNQFTISSRSTLVFQATGISGTLGSFGDESGTEVHLQFRTGQVDIPAVRNKVGGKCSSINL